MVFVYSYVGCLENTSSTRIGGGLYVTRKITGWERPQFRTERSPE